MDTTTRPQCRWPLVHLLKKASHGTSPLAGYLCRNGPTEVSYCAAAQSAVFQDDVSCAPLQLPFTTISPHPAEYLSQDVPPEEFAHAFSTLLSPILRSQQPLHGNPACINNIHLRVCKHVHTHAD